MASREERSLQAILSEQPRCAAFDLEKTIINSNVVETYAWLATRHLDRTERARVVAGLMAEGPKLLAVDRRDRSRLPSSLLPALRGRPRRSAPSRRTPGSCSAIFSSASLSRRDRAGPRHRALGHKTLLITGALDFVVEPLRPLFDEIVCASIGRA